MNMATNVYGSDMPADNCYGENGYTGQSSVVPGQPAVSCDLEASKGLGSVPAISQTRQVSAKPLATRVGRGASAQWK
jgi:hypothetical protein